MAGHLYYAQKICKPEQSGENYCKSVSPACNQAYYFDLTSNRFQPELAAGRLSSHSPTFGTSSVHYARQGVSKNLIVRYLEEMAQTRARVSGRKFVSNPNCAGYAESRYLVYHFPAISITTLGRRSTRRMSTPDGPQPR